MNSLIRRVGANVEVLSTTEVRYTGILTGYNEEKKTITLEQALSHGTEDRPSKVWIPPIKQAFEYVVLRIENISRIRVIEINKNNRKRKDYSAWLEQKVQIPEEEYDFDKNNAQIEKRKRPPMNVFPYNPSFFYDTL